MDTAKIRDSRRRDQQLYQPNFRDRSLKEKARFRLVLIRMFNTTFVGTGVLDCPQQKNFGRDVVFSSDLCYNVVTCRGMGFAYEGLCTDKCYAGSFESVR